MGYKSDQLITGRAHRLMLIYRLSGNTLKAVRRTCHSAISEKIAQLQQEEVGLYRN